MDPREDPALSLRLRSGALIDLLVVLLVVGIAVSVGIIVMAKYPAYSLQATKAAPPRLERGYQLPSLPGYDWGSHTETLVLALRLGCPYCEDSMEFYGRLLDLEKQRKINAHVVAIYQESAELIRSHRPAVPPGLLTLASTRFPEFRIYATPTVLIVNSNGVAQRIWRGRLSTELENELLLVLAQPAAKVVPR